MIALKLRFDEFVGRSEEMAFLRARFAEVAQGCGSAVVVTGAAGIGKSRLAREFRAALREESHRFAAGMCHAYTRGSLEPFGSVLRDLAQSEANVLRAHVEAVNAGSEGDGLSPADRKMRVFDALLGYLRVAAANGPPLAISIEDLHWADDATLDLFEHLVKYIDRLPLLLVATMREGAIEHDARFASFVQQLTRDGASLVRLEPLTLSEVRRLTGNVLRDRHRLPSQTVARIEDLSGGNPLYLEELLRGALERVEHGDALDTSIPETLKGMVLERASRFPRRIRQVLTTAAVLGVTFDLSVLTLVTQRSRHTIVEALQRAKDAHLIVDVPGWSGRYRFRHPLIREALYEEVSPELAVSLHSAVATAFEDRFDPSACAVDLAHHYSAAGTASKAVIYNELAGDQAMALCAYRDAARFFRCALSFGPEESERQAGLSAKLARALVGDGSLQEAKECAWRAVDGYLKLADRSSTAQVLMDLYPLCWADGDVDSVVRAMSTALNLVRQGVEPAACRNLLLLAGECFALLRMPAAAKRALEAAGELPESEPQARLHRSALQAHVAFLEGDCEQSQAALENVLAEAADIAGSFGVRIYERLSVLYAMRGMLEAAEKTARAAVNLADARSVGVVWQGRVKLKLADVLFNCGKLTEAFSVFEGAYADVADIRGLRLCVAAVGIPIAIAIGELDALKRLVDDEVVEEAASSVTLPWAPPAVGAFAEAFAVQGRSSEAGVLLHRAIQQVAPANDLVEFLLAAASYGDLGDLPLARSMLGQTVAQTKSPPAHAYADFFDAIVARREGRAADQRRLGLLAASAFESLGMPLFRARALELAGRPKQALTVYQSIGARRDSGRLEQRFEKRRKTNGLLTRRQSEIAPLLLDKKSNREIACLLNVSENTLEVHIRAIFRRLGIRSRRELLRMVTPA
ncbi:MAG TPA: AAA family ATPase [Candidatus Acidoferrales bacterium]|nr:AAA family ATPase [Candidatus Acidoferrales bacterium]